MAEKSKSPRETEFRTLTLQAPVALVEQLEQFAVALEERWTEKNMGVRARRLSRSEAVRHLLLYGLKRWRAELEDAQGPETVF